jgi:hypothetical protein
MPTVMDAALAGGSVLLVGVSTKLIIYYANK